ncbi:aldo/keto reductase [Mucilaginibacter terrae]|uniref:Diketogulonate reductase-like aldo/keto reductase n=1 Tax=Mucilaginibacter terrae TaxID=1955052 RepID=A0ABU3H0A1_9SPHI|nr:aldo/keto reductase [Mucilaginibacter terrae]MDT3405444.1 diketogulonate reductase-like aldo/keto reductase [Mucilaginibacter terrae]
MLKRIIPSSGENLPVIGLGTWQTFDAPNSQSYPVLENVLRKMHQSGGSLIDSSPMYGRSEQVIGDITSQMDIADQYFYATKVWTRGLQEGIRQMENSMLKMKRKNLDLIQIHNLTDWQTHLPILQRWKETGRIKYVGITHYTDSSHEELEKIMRTQQVDFVQFNFSISERHAEKRLLDAAADMGVATIINRPFGSGNLFSKVKGKALPAWAKDFKIESWSAYFLKYIVSHPAATCVIPATADISHAADNFKAGSGDLPDQAAREKMVTYLKQL